MAQLPTIENIQNWIFEEIRSSGINPRVDDVAFRITPMQLALHRRGVQAEEYNDALSAMVEAGFLYPAKNGSFMMLTATGFARL